jgi:hypothetical protein
MQLLKLKDKLADADEEKSIAYFLAKPATNLACTGRAMCRPEGTMPHSGKVFKFYYGVYN